MQGWADPVNVGVWIVMVLFVAFITLSCASRAWPLW